MLRSMRRVYWCAASDSFPGGNHVEHGAEGVVEGPDPVEPDKCVVVRFPTGTIAAYATDLSARWPPPSLPGDFEVGDAVQWCGATEKVSTGDLLEYSAHGEVAGPAADRDQHNVNVRFPENKGHVSCPVAMLARKWPPLPLPGDFNVGGLVHFCAASATLDKDHRVVYGARGMVAGPHHESRRVFVRFANNKGNVGCFVTDLCRTWPPPPLPGGFSVGDGVFFAGVRCTFPSGDRKE